MGKATNFKFCTHIHREQKPVKNFGKSTVSLWAYSVTLEIFQCIHSLYRAHRAVIFAVAQLSCFVVRFVADIRQQKCMKGPTSSNVPARNTLVQLLALYTNPESQNAQRHRQTDRQTDDRITSIADHTAMYTV